MDKKMKPKLIYLNVLLSLIIEIVIAIQKPGYSTPLLLNPEAVIWPVFLFIFNIVLISTKVEKSALKCALFMFAGFFLGNVSNYIIWGMKTGYLLRPDYETRGFMLLKLGYYFFATSLFFIVSTILSWLKNPFVLKK